MYDKSHEADDQVKPVIVVIMQEEDIVQQVCEAFLLVSFSGFFVFGMEDAAVSRQGYHEYTFIDKLEEREDTDNQ